jgi:apolipoprotein N-acyltransferase
MQLIAMLASEVIMNGQKNNYPVKDRWSYLWLVIGLLLFIPYQVPLVSWVASIFHLRFLRSQRTRRGFLIFFLGALLPVGVIIYPFLGPLGMTSIPLILILVAFTAIIAALPLLVDRLMVPRLSGILATLVFPLASTMIDFVNNKTSYMGSTMDSSYNAYGNLALMQLVSITGIWGIVFLTRWLGAVVNYAWERGFAWKEIRRGVLVFSAVMLAVIVYGSVRLAYAPEANRTVRIHGFTAVEDMRYDIQELGKLQSEDWEAYRQYSKGLQDLYMDGTLREAKAGAQIVHWPEMAVILAKEDEAAFLDRAGQIARDENIYIVMAYGAVPQEGKWENKAVIMDPTGKVLLEHEKYALAEQEGTLGGDGIIHAVDTPYGRLSLIICADTDHEEVVAQVGRNGADILFSPALEMREIDPMHAHVAVYRAIENGVTVVRQATSGLSIVADPYGRVVASMDHFNTTDRVMVAAVPIQQTFTLYSYTPDLFGWLAVVGFTSLVIWSIVQSLRLRKNQSANDFSLSGGAT